MSQKRQQEDGKASSEGNSRRKRPSFRNVVQEVMSLCKFKRFMEPALEPLIRKVVREEVDSAFRKYMTSMKWTCAKEMHSSEARSLQLQFLLKISLPVFTGTRIEGEDCNTLEVALFDALTGNVVSSGPESSAKVEIVVLEGDFDGDEGHNWTIEEFKNNIVRAREGKKCLLMGDALLNLKEGIGLVGEIFFTDNSSWTRSRKFRLGARVLDIFDGIRIREAKTESFIVRDHRGELYKKHHPPSLVDDVWRLEKIGKDGAFHRRLNMGKVYTVKDFLTLLFVDPSKLKNILGTGMSPKMWEVTIDHAQTCILDSKLFFYHPVSQRKTGVVFNVVGKVLGLLTECRYFPIDKLSKTEKDEARDLVIAAYKQWDRVIPFDDEASLIDGSSHLLNFDLYSSSAIAETSNDNDSKSFSSQKISEFDGPQQIMCSPEIIPSICSPGDVNSLDDFGLHTMGMDLRYHLPLNFPGQVSNSLISETEPTTQAFGEDEHLQYLDTECSPQSKNSISGSHADLHSAVSGFLLPSSATFAQRRWTIVFSVLKWFSIKRIVANKTHNREKPRYS